MENSALILIDFVNEIVDSNGKLAGKGYPDYISRHDTAAKVAALLAKAREKGWLICHVRVGFDSAYVCHPTGSPLFGAAKKFGALDENEWGCEFIDYAQPKNEEFVLRKRRVSAFYNTDLDTVLKANQIGSVFLAGCATDLAVQSAARDAHDRDYAVTVVADACAAANDDDHLNSITVLEKIASVLEVGNL